MAAVSTPGPNVTAAHNEGKPFRPSLFELAEIFAAWGPNSPVDLDIHPSTEWKLVSRTCTSDRNNRIDLSTWSGWRHRRIFGYIAEISETTSGNSDTPFRFEVISKVPYLAGCRQCRLVSGSNLIDADLLSWVWVRTTAYSSCALVPPGTAIRLGTFVQVVVAARYNGTNKATLEAWSLADWGDWENTAGDTLITHNEVSL